MSTDWSAAQVADDLNRYSPAVGREFAAAGEALRPRLTEDEWRRWAEAGHRIARNAFRTWESAIEYFRASPAVLDRIGFAPLLRWAAFGRDLSNDSAVIASAYFRSSPEVLRRLAAGQVEEWGWLGRNLYQGHWKSGELSAKFYEAGPALLDILGARELAYLARLLELLAAFSFEVAIDCLARSEAVLRQVDRPFRRPLLTLLSTVAERNWKAALTLLDGAPEYLRVIHPGHREAFLTLAREIGEKSAEDARALCLDAAPAFREIDPKVHGDLIRIAGEIRQIQTSATVAFVRSAPTLLRRTATAGVEQWVREGSRVLRRNADAGNAYFRIESARAEQALAQISRGVELQGIRDLLRLYSKALTGRDIAIRSAEDLADQALGWTSSERPTTEGSAIFLPPYLEHFASKDENFAAYKVLTTHQAAHLEFGTFRFAWDRAGAIFPRWREEVVGRTEEGAPPHPAPTPPHPALSPGDRVEATPHPSPLPAGEGAGGALRPAGERATSTPDSPRPTPFVDFERFFDLFAERALAKDLFTAVEDGRIDARIRARYRGLRRALAASQAHALEGRPNLLRLTAWTALVELILQAGLGHDRTADLPARLQPLATALIALARDVEAPAATVEDSVEATLRLYALITRLPNVPLHAIETGEWDDGGLAVLSDIQALAAGLDQGQGEGLPVYQSVEDVDFRGDLKPELVQTLMKIREDGSDQVFGEGAPLSAEELRDLLEKGAEIEISALYEGEIDESMGLFVNNLLKQSGKQSAGKVKGKERHPKAEAPAPDDTLDPGVETFLYPEWDFRSGDYRPDWCRLKQRVIEEGTERFYDDTLTEYAALALAVRRQFELLRPEMFKKLKRLEDGEEYDLDEVIAAAVERRAGLPPSEKLYTRKNKLQRDVAVAFLIDMSASTDEEIKDEQGRVAFPLTVQPEPRVYRTTFPTWAAPDEDPPPLKGKRILDLEKESIVLLIQALETIGDTYGIYGFSGYGRESVDFYVIKDLDETFGDTIKRRIDKIEPVRSTRMGTAIRHATAKLDRREAKLKAIILVSDGRPQDYDYGKDRTEKDYAIHDTKMALLEAKQRHIVPFCLTVDKAGHDWMKQMCEDIGYEIVDDIESLPKRLPGLYRKLTT